MRSWFKKFKQIILKQAMVLLGLWLAVLAFLIKFIYVFIGQNEQLAGFVRWIPYQYHRRAMALINHGLAQYGNAWGSYYLALAFEFNLFRWLGVNDFVKAGVIVNILMGAGAVYCFFRLAEYLFGQTKALITTGLLILYFPLTYFNGLLVSENLFTLLLIWGIWLLIKAAAQKNRLKFFWPGLMLGLAAGIRGMLLPFLPMAWLWLLLQLKKTELKVKVRIIALSWFSTGILVPLIVLGLLNYRFSHQHKFQLDGSVGVNLAMAQCQYKKVRYELPNGESHWFSPPVFWGTDREEVNTAVAFYDQGYYVKMALNCLKEKPENLINNLNSLVNIFHSTFYPKFEMKPLMEEMLMFSKVLAILSFGLFLVYPLVSKDRKKYWLFFGLIMSLFVSVYLANSGEERYLVPYVFIFFLYVPAVLEKLTRLGKQ